MIRKDRAKFCATGVVMLCLCACFLYSTHALSNEAVPAPRMPSHWKVTSDSQLPTEQVRAMSARLGANLSSVRNTVYNVNGKRIQINVIVTPDSANAEKLMTKLRSMKSEEALLRKDLTVYEFVGQNDVLTLIKEGRKHLFSM